MVEAQADAAGLIGFWRAVEMLEPQDVPESKRAKEPGGTFTIDVGPGEPGPWEPGPRLVPPATEGRSWQFTVYGGLFTTTGVTAALARTFGVEDPVPPDGRRGGTAALYAFTLNAQGQVLRFSPTLSACGWAVGRLHPGRLPDLDGFDDEQRGFATGLARLSAGVLQADTGSPAGGAVGRQLRDSARAAVGAGARATGTAVTAAAGAAVTTVAGPVVGGIAGAVAGGFAERLLTPPGASAPAPQPVGRVTGMTSHALHRFTRDLATRLGVAESLRPAGLRVSCVQVRGPDEGTQSFLNSFIADDLARIAEHAARGDVGSGLAAYLSRRVDTTRRIDVRTRPDLVVRAVAPSNIPDGRWPDDVDKPLAMSQQFAVNEILGRLRHTSGIVSVNGPPGTGKTTLLRDVMAALVVDRAVELARLHAPEDAFTDVIETVRLTSRYSAAVRRVRPALTGVEMVVTTAGNRAAQNITVEIPGVDAVGRQADDARALDHFVDIAERLITGPAWGLMAASLGNSALNKKFRDTFWFNSEAGPTMKDLLKDAEDAPERVEPWDVAVARFRDAHHRVRRLGRERDEVARALADVPALRQRIRHADGQVRRAQETRNRWHHEWVRAVAAYEAAVCAVADVEQRLDHHVRRQPNLWVSLSTWFRAGRQWAAGSNALHVELTNARSDAHAAHTSVTRAVDETDRAHADVDRWSGKARGDRVAVELARRCLDEAHRRWPDTVPPDPAAVSEEALQLCAPWADREFTEARNQLFLAAMALHGTFVRRAARPLRHNLAVAVTATQSRRPEITPEALHTAWQSLFLVVPVVSTTFASLPRLFGGLGREGLGWLFVDEAGQASAQQLVGGIWRAARTVVVGDPQQLEPIGTLPLPAQQELGRRYRVEDEWLPDVTSAQLVADRLSEYGTTLPDRADPTGEREIWVGAPLRVHRRCDRPMFEVSNRIAYAGRMVFGTPDRHGFPGHDGWIDVPPGPTEGNWLPAEGEALGRLLEHLATWPSAPGLAVLSPFRQVIDNVRTPVKRLFEEAEVGTVHTMQGRESDVVVIVLGGDPTSGARAWATEKPNLLNVAVSRAKRRLYVIGDRDGWRRRPGTDVLSELLPDRAPW